MKSSSPAKANTAPKITLDRARAHWHRKQGLAQPITGALEDVVGATGWPRTLGGIDAYLAVRARVPKLKRSDLDRAVQTSRLQVVPAVRGCIYLVPRSEVPLVLRIAEEQQRKRVDREHEKVGIKPSELAEVGAAALAALKKGPLSSDGLRKALPEGVIRSLGEKGKKAGISSTLPPALRQLEFEGRIERTLDGGRIDTERYLWRTPVRNPFDGARVPDDSVERYARLASIFFRQVGPATVKDFSSWTALSQRDALAAVQRLPMVPIAIEAYDDSCLIFEDELPALRGVAPHTKSISFLALDDTYLVSHRGPAAVTPMKHHDREVDVWGHSRGSTLGEARHIQMRSLIVGDQLVGMWEYDPDGGRVVFATFDPLPPKQRAAVETAGDELASFIRDDLENARSFSLDSMDEVRKRAAAIKAMATT